MTTALTTPSTQLVALTPSEMAVAQTQLVGWCRDKIVALGRELREQRENLRQAKTMKWRHSAWATAVRKTKARMIYFAKIKAAVAEGYLIVPNFDVEVIAVRVQRHSPVSETDVEVATPELLPPGSGRYVDDELIGYNQKREYTRSDGTKGSATDFHPTEYDDIIDFPAGLVKPIVMQAAERAMTHKIFDRLGIVRKSRRSDPLVVGQIIDPTMGNKYGQLRNNPKCVTFFIAWWLDPETL